MGVSPDENNVHRQFTSGQDQFVTTTTVKGLGWIEALPSQSEVYYCHTPTAQFWHQLNSATDDALKNNFLEESGKLGVVIKLMQDRAVGPFVLPKVFNTYSDGISAGWSRLAAEMICGVERSAIDGITITDNTATLVKKFEHFEKLTSTKQFEQQIFQHRPKPTYAITWDQDSNNIVRVSSTLLLDDQLFNEPCQIDTFKHFNDSRLDFLRRYQHNQKIQIKVCCTESTAELIQYDEKVFDVVFEFQDASTWEFSYGVLLGKYRYLGERKPESSLNLWVFNIEQPLALTKLLMWTTVEHGAYYTKNRKVALYDPDLNTTVKEIPDIVK